MPAVDVKGVPILIVDDNYTNREALRGQLQHWGASVTEAESAQTALRLMENRLDNTASPCFSVAFLDMQMPGSDGVELSKSIRADSRFDQTRLVMMTSMSSRGDAKFFADLGFCAYFPKPVTTSDLFDSLAVVIDGGEALTQAQPLVTHHYLQGLKKLGVEGNQTVNPGAVAEPIQWPKNVRLLMVEDNCINQQVALGLLEGMGLSCDVAGNGIEALAALKQTPKSAPYHLVLMDFQMPEMDGFEATRQIRSGTAGDAYRDLPIIAMTANAMKGDKEKCLDHGMSDYLSKPVEPEDLEQMMSKWLIEATEHNHDTEVWSNTVKQQGSDKRELVVWDKPSALKRLGGKEERLMLLVNIFLEDMPDRVKGLQKSIDENALPSYSETEASRSL